MKEVVKKAKSVGEAIDLACDELGVCRDDITFEILDLPKKSFLGLKNTLAAVKVCVNKSEHELELKNLGVDLLETVSSEEQLKAFELATNGLTEYLAGILANFGLENVQFETELTPKAHIINITISKGKNLNLFCEDEDLMAAVQHLGNVYLNKRCRQSRFPRVILNLNNFMEKRQAKLKQLVENMSRIVLKNNTPATMEPMSSYERMLVHNIVSTIPGLASSSVGDGIRRKVVLFPQKEA